MTEKQIKKLVKNYWEQVEVSKYKTVSLEDYLRKVGLTEDEIEYGLTIGEN